jgi:hypothetical protein
MDTLTNCTTGLGPVKWSPTPLRGRYLRRSLNSKLKAAFVGADLYRGDTQLVEPSLMQAAFITGSEVSAVWWALQRGEFRSEICLGLMPLAPSRASKAKAPISDPEVINFVRTVGIGRVLDAAVAVEAAQ